MPRSVNKVILLGNLGRDPELRYTASGTPVASFSIATSRQWRDNQTNDMREETEWHDIVCWGRTAEVASQYLTKGRQVYIEGELRTNSWEQEGETRSKKEVHARELVLVGGGGGEYSGARRGTSSPEQRGNEPRSGPDPHEGDSRRQAAKPVSDDDAELDDDIPF